MALPPCHMFCQFYVADGELSCQVSEKRYNSSFYDILISHIIGIFLFLLTLFKWWSIFMDFSSSFLSGSSTLIFYFLHFLSLPLHLPPPLHVPLHVPRPLPNNVPFYVPFGCYRSNSVSPASFPILFPSLSPFFILSIDVSAQCWYGIRSPVQHRIVRPSYCHDGTGLRTQTRQVLI